jgi:hypothetical protein
MKLRVQAGPGELEERVEDAVKVLRKLAGQDGCCDDRLEKAASRNADHVPRKLDIPALRGGVDRASKTVQRIRRKMLADMLEVLKED